MGPAVEMVIEAGIDRIRRKSVQMETRVHDLPVRRDSGAAGLLARIARESSAAGFACQYRHQEGYRINRALIEEMKVLPIFENRTISPWVFSVVHVVRGHLAHSRPHPLRGGRKALSALSEARPPGDVGIK